MIPIIDLYDSEILELEKVLEWMRKRQGQRMDLEDFRRAAKEKFAEAGFKVDIRVFTTTEEGVYHFEPQIEGRIEKREFDYDRMVHEVTGNILELPDQDKGVIKADAALAQMERDRKSGRTPKHTH